MQNGYDRRGFLKMAASAGIGLGLDTGRLAGLQAGPGPVHARGLFRAAPMDTVRVGFVGVGNRGSRHVLEFLKMDGVEIRAVCDVVPAKVERIRKMVTAAGRPEPAAYSRGPDDHRRMSERSDLDLVVNSTPWEWHAPVALAAMRAGKHVAVEVPMAVTLDECWALVETAEQTQLHCVMLENTCYDRTELMILNMVRKGLFGELLHAECGYLHDLRAGKLSAEKYEGQWRLKHSITRNGDLYPTHGIGPVAQWLDVNRGNQFDHLVSMSSKSRGLNLWAAEHIGPDSPEARRRYALGDVVNTLIRTRAGQTIVVTHDTNTPRPYSRKVLLQGTRGVVRKYPEEKIHLEGRSPNHEWEELKSYRAEHEHPLWLALEENAKGGGHGGMDYIQTYRLIQSLREGAPMDMDVYDGASWSAISELSERSIAARSRSIGFPDFTRGAWENRAPLPVVNIG